MPPGIPYVAILLVAFSFNFVLFSSPCIFSSWFFIIIICSWSFLTIVLKLTICNPWFCAMLSQISPRFMSFRICAACSLLKHRLSFKVVCEHAVQLDNISVVNNAVVFKYFIFKVFYLVLVFLVLFRELRLLMFQVVDL